VRAAQELAPPSVLVVQNDRIEDLWIYVDRDGVRGRKIGVAHGYRSDTLLLVNSDLANRATVGFVAIGSLSGIVERSGQATSQEDASYRWYVGAVAGRSVLSWRPAGR
jgi:hypothetical protein